MSEKIAEGRAISKKLEKHPCQWMIPLNQVIPDDGNCQKRRTLFESYLLEFE